MTSSSSVTQCPDCKTAFHVGPAQLEAAGGKVRCGNCLEIFNAKEYFVVEQKRLFENAPSASQVSPTEKHHDQLIKDGPDDRSPDDNDSSDDDLGNEGPVILGNYDPNAGVRIPRSDVQKLSQQASPDFGEELKIVPGDHRKPLPEDFIVDIDNPLPPEEREAILGEALETAKSLTRKLPAKPPVEPDSSAPRYDDSTGIDLEHLQEEDLEHLGTTDTSIEPIAAASPTETQINKEALAEEETQTPDDASKSETTQESDAPPKSDSPQKSKVPTKPGASDIPQKPQAKVEPEELEEHEELEEPHSASENNPVEQDAIKEDHSLNPDYFIEPNRQAENDIIAAKRAHPAWSIAAGLLVIILIGELLFLQPQTLRQMSWFQSLSGGACSILPCEAQPFLNIEEIDLSGFVEPNAELPDILTAHIELRNRAGAAQAFPKIAVYFRDLRGKITASRAFAPSEYLKGDARGLEQMPLNRPIQIEIDFVDPGKHATSYELGLLP